jgi:hypothetical protein
MYCPAIHRMVRCFDLGVALLKTAQVHEQLAAEQHRMVPLSHLGGTID